MQRREKREKIGRTEEKIEKNSLHRRSEEKNRKKSRSQIGGRKTGERERASEGSHACVCMQAVVGSTRLHPTDNKEVTIKKVISQSDHQTIPKRKKLKRKSKTQSKRQKT